MSDNQKPVSGISAGSEPFLLSPSGKDYLWGGTRLKTEFSKALPLTPLAETWECSTHPDGPCFAASGKYKGVTLARILKENPEYLGTHPRTEGELPILIKFIDAAKDLSVQVHPDDTYARLHENGQQGKTEMWYVLDARPGAQLVYGLRHSMTPEALREAVDSGTLKRHLQNIEVHRDDLFLIRAGTIHAIGAGVLVAEIQENSNLTYRLYDYDRTDKDGKKRPLHVEKALAVANLAETAEPKQPPRILRYRRGAAEELLCRCEYFQVSRLLINTADSSSLDFCSDSTSFRVLLCLEGRAEAVFDGGCIDLEKGSCLFVPACSVPIQLRGSAQFLDVRG